MKPLESIVDILRNIRANQQNAQLLNYMEDGKWKAHSTEQVLLQIKYLTLGLISIGVKKGDHIGIITLSSPYWTMIDCAIIIAGGITVPLFANLSYENFEFEIKQSETKILVVLGKEQWTKYECYSELFDQIITIENDCQEIGISYSQLIQKGKELEKSNPNLYEEMENLVKPDELATLIYTSGTTGLPKGVKYTNKNLVALSHVEDFLWDYEKDRYLSILPLAHVFGRCVILSLIFYGVSVYYSNDIKNVGNICREIHPTFIAIVPRLLEKMYAKMLSKVNSAGFLKKMIGLWAFKLANQEKKSLFKMIMHPLLDKIVYSTLREALGGSIRVIICGGAPLNPHLCHFFIEIGIPIYEGWGMTEASTISCNVPAKRKIGTVGKAFSGVEVITSPDGELLVKGAIVMQEYHKNPEATEAVWNEKGYLRTGDRGSIDEDGYITISGRIKELYKTSTGEYIAPLSIEQKLCEAPFIDMAVVVGEGRKFASCLLFPDMSVMENLKSTHQYQDMTVEEFLNSDLIKNEMNNLLDQINQHVNHWEQLHAYRFVLNPLSIEKGELTPSLKICRVIVMRNFIELIDQMYEDDKAA